MPQNYIAFETVMSSLAIALSLSLVNERIIEFIKNGLLTRLGSVENKKLPALSEIDEEIDEIEDAHENNGDGEYDEEFTHSKILVEPATDPNDEKTLYLFVIQLLGFAIGIILARVSGLKLFSTFFPSPGAIPGWISGWGDYLLTGLFIGGGSGPVHVLVRFISERKLTLNEEEQESGTAPVPEKISEMPVVSATGINVLSGPDITKLNEIRYGGGVDVEKLEHVHLRKKNPDMIVYHHTQMGSSTTFEDVVRVIKNRHDKGGNRWLTGYNCVILADGSVHPFCRWDRAGNHAIGYNGRSLGIAFNGNFETDPVQPFSNPGGKYGLKRPADEQLKAGARVMVLWTYLYGIKIDFKKTIIPHKEVSGKTCPGSSFPYDELQNYVKHYRKKWDRSKEVKEWIQEFKLKPYLYV